MQVLGVKCPVPRMCGRFLISATPDSVAACFGLAVVPELHPRWNVAPTQSAPVVRLDASGARRLDPLRWGLVPHWAKDVSIGSRMINARSETAHEKPSFRSLLPRQRCLVVTDGFYEWKKEGDIKQPWCIRAADDGVFAFGGLWSTWQGEEGPLETFTILTTRPNRVLAPIHDRMPVIIQPESFETWLDPANGNIEVLQQLMEPVADDLLHAWPVSRLVNRPANDDPSCIEPVEAGATD